MAPSIMTNSCRYDFNNDYTHTPKKLEEKRVRFNNAENRNYALPVLCRSTQFNFYTHHTVVYGEFVSTNLSMLDAFCQVEIESLSENVIIWKTFSILSRTRFFSSSLLS